ncbi:hypothetical protein F5Y16DRAFT_365028 [Xylariaceae sp. FL0255]|nr:hypothetical protein F5Y16DRAFT_365028 [Xylariaceae sp. FL0255]
MSAQARAPTLSASSSTTSTLARQILDHTAPHYTFSFSPFLHKTYGHELSSPSSSSAAKNSQSDSNQQNSSYNSLVCKHWLRALCKKGEGCEFLHEYNLRKMPECNFFVRNGYCSNGDECLYLHIDPLSKLPPCPHYDMGFCPLGPDCSKRHVRRKLCPYYLAGFCPDGKTCTEGAHPRWEKNLEKPVAKSEAMAQQQQQREQQLEEFKREGGDGGFDDDGGFGRGGGEFGRDNKSGTRGGFGGGRGGRWRGRGDRKFRGRGHH